MLPTYDFLSALKFASHAMGKNDARPYLNGVSFRFRGDRLTLTGSDGHRVASIRLIVEGCELEGDYIAKAASVKALLKAVKTKRTDQRKAHLAPQGNGIAFVTDAGDQAVLDGMTDGWYPDFSQFEKRDNPDGAPAVKLNCEYLADAARACNALGSDTAYVPLLLQTWTRPALSTVRIICTPSPFFTALEGDAQVHIMPMKL